MLNMEEVRKYLVSIHQMRVEHPTATAAFEAFGDVWTTFIGDSTQGMFCQHVADNGYPIDEGVVSAAPYVPRIELEQKINSAIRRRQDVAIIGEEGIGKTTTIHYLLGHRHWRQERERFNRNQYIYVNAIAFDASPENITSKLYDSLFNGIAKTVLDPERRIFETEMRQLGQLSVLKSLTWNPAESKSRYVELFLTYRSVKQERNKIFVIIDNIDSVSALSARHVFASLKALNSNIRHTIREYLRDTGIGESFKRDEVDSTLRYIIPVRPETWAMIQSPSEGLFPLRNPLEVTIDKRSRLTADVWDLIRDEIRRSLKSNPTASRLRTLNIPIPLQEGVSFSERANPKFFDGLIDWLQLEAPESDRLIKSFCGGSIRRQKMYGLKVAGHIAVARAFFRQTSPSYRARLGKQTRNSLLTEAIFDFSQGFGASGTYSGFHLNPYRMIKDYGRWHRNPLIGLQSLLYLDRNRGKLRRQAIVAHCITVGPLVEQLRDMSYDDLAIQEMFHYFRASGLLRRSRASNKIMESAGGLNALYYDYILDEDALAAYIQLVSFAGRRKDAAISFMNSATRSNYSIEYSALSYSIYYKCFLNLLFLHDMIDREGTLTEKVALSSFKGDVPSYVSIIYRPMVRMWGGVIKEARGRRLRANEEGLLRAADFLLRQVRRAEDLSQLTNIPRR